VLLDGGFGGADNWALRMGDAGVEVVCVPDDAAGLSTWEATVLSGAGLIFLTVRC